ncbi:hypothetical protein AB1K62_14015 [Parasphingorhabdus sp. JC815]|uniref:hypothetical protein n=1 Tax=Parasphingorhabdus sp. JC815 TaxID=3232140 RepID=UPI003458DECC
MNWKRNIQVLDLDPDIRLELVCRKCKKLRWLTGKELLKRQTAKFLYLEDIERRARCRQRGCRGTMRMAMPGEGETSGFIGGIA